MLLLALPADEVFMFNLHGFVVGSCEVGSADMGSLRLGECIPIEVYKPTLSDPLIE